ncbi:MAG: trypsin-like serine protease [Chloroflexi bacterium]|nr:trypsin-like serine protease [Chloroflexota bacterium]
MRTKLFVLVAVVVLLLLMVAPTAAVTDGELDGDAHPQVVLLLMEVGGQPAFRCSGTLLSSTVLLTAGHCTNNYPGAPYTGMRVFTESDVQAGIGTTNNYPFAGPNSVEAVSWAAHPLYETAPFFVHDVGVVILQAPGVILPPDKYATLPTANQFDSFKTKRGLQNVTFTSVGYGLQESFPDAASWKEHNTRTRYVAHPRLLQINVPGFTGDFSLLLSNNHATGGTCFGDSGGPNFLGNTNVVAGVTSFGINGNCAGTGGVFRMDRQNVLDFVDPYLP